MRAGTRNGSSTTSAVSNSASASSDGHRQDAVAARAGPGRRSAGGRSCRWPAPTAPSPATSRAARARAGARPARRGRRWPPSSCACPDAPTRPAIDENITNADRSRSRVSSCRFHAASTLARSTVSTRSGVSDVTHGVVEHAGGVDHRGQRRAGGRCPPAPWPARRGRRRRRRPPARWAPASVSSATSSAAPGASGPRRDSSSRSRTPWCGDDVAGDRRAGHAGAAGDQHGAAGPRVGHGHARPCRCGGPG